MWYDAMWCGVVRCGSGAACYGTALTVGVEREAGRAVAAVGAVGVNAGAARAQLAVQRALVDVAARRAIQLQQGNLTLIDSQ